VTQIRVLLADDHELFRAGIRSLLQGFAGVEVVAEAANGRECIQQAREHHPDVAVVDVMMPELNGLDAAARLAAELPDVRIIMLSMSTSDEYIRQALRAGASGYLFKTVSPEELELAIRSVARGATYLPAAVSKQLRDQSKGPADSVAASLLRLSPRQREILQLIAEGFTTKQIAAKLDISPKTTETHRSQLMDALDIHDVAGLVRYAIRSGLISVD
jgi:DNA-binding NarL/FixJ family response regulator